MKLTLTAPPWFVYLCAALMVGYAISVVAVWVGAAVIYIQDRLEQRRQRPRVEVDFVGDFERVE